MSVLLDGRTDDLAFKIDGAGRLSVSGRGVATITLLTGPGEPPDEPHELAAAWQVDSLSPDGEPPDYLRNSRSLRGLDAALKRSHGKDLLIVALLDARALIESAERPAVSVFLLIGTQKFESIRELLVSANNQAPAAYQLASWGVIELLDADSPNATRFLPFEEWSTKDEAFVAIGNIDFTISRRADSDASKGNTDRLSPIRHLLAVLIVLSALSVALQCAKAW